MGRLPFLLVAIALGLLGLGIVRERALTAGERRELPAGEDAPPAPVPASLSALRADESAWLGRRVSFVLQFRERIEDWDPRLSRFGPVRWCAFSAWADEVFTWDPEVFGTSLPYLFVRRGSALEELLLNAKTYDRFRAVGTVRETFLDEPWIEVEALEPMPESVGEGTILHVGRAREFMVQRQWELALQQFDRAKASPLPAHARAEIERQIDACIRLREEQKQAKRGS